MTKVYQICSPSPMINKMIFIDTYGTVTYNDGLITFSWDTYHKALFIDDEPMIESMVKYDVQRKDKLKINQRYSHHPWIIELIENK